MKDYVKQPSFLKGWSVINEELCEVSLRCVSYKLRCDELEMDKLSVLHHGESHVVKFSNYYASEEDYRNGKPMDASNARLNISDRANAKDDGFEFWTMEDGTPTKKFRCVTTVCKSVADPDDVVYDSIPDISKIYKTREECLAWNEYVISYEDGRKETRKGAGLLLQLTDEQKKAVENVSQALKYATELGVRFRTLYGDCYAFNANELGKFETAYEGDEKYYKEDGMDEKFNIVRKEFRSPFGVYDIGEDSTLFFSRK